MSRGGRENSGTGRERGNGSSSSNSNSSGLHKDFEVCMIEHTANLDGSKGAYGDLQTLKCIIDKQTERGNRGEGNCIISACTKITYDNPFLRNHSPEALISLYNEGGMEAVNKAMNDNNDNVDLIG